MKLRLLQKSYLPRLLVDKSNRDSGLLHASHYSTDT